MFLAANEIVLALPGEVVWIFISQKDKLILFVKFLVPFFDRQEKRLLVSFTNAALTSILALERLLLE